MKKWPNKSPINIGLFVIFFLILGLIILSIVGIIILPNYGFIVLPLTLVTIIVIAKGDFSIKIGDILEIKKEISSVKKEIGILNTKISNINANQNITVLSVNPTGIKEILDKVKSQTILRDPNITVSSPADSKNGNSDKK